MHLSKLICFSLLFFNVFIYSLKEKPISYVYLMPLRASVPLDLIFEDFVYFLKKNKAALNKVSNGS